MNDVTKRFWEATYRQSIAKMIGLCYRYTFDRQIAEDLAHDAFLIAIAKSASYEHKGPFDAWLRRIVVNVALQYFREQKRQKSHQDKIAYETISIESPEEANHQPENAFSEPELLAAISQLPEHHKLVFNLYVFDNFTHAQIGAELGISEGTSKSHLARARKKIREILLQKRNENTTRKRLGLLVLLPNKLGMIDQLVRRQLTNFAIPPQRTSSIDSADFRDVSFPTSKPTFFFSEAYIKTNLVTIATVLNIAVVSFLHVTANPTMKAPIDRSVSTLPLVSELPSKKNTDQTSEKEATPTATFSKNTIIASKQTITSETMKKINTVGALLLTSSALAFDSTALLSKFQLPTRFPNQLVAENTKRETERPIDQIPPAIKQDSQKISGTFYASELVWSSVNNELYFEGSHVKVNLNTQNFTGRGRFSFLNKVSYVVVDGVVMKLNDTISLSDKKYRLVKLTPAEATKKYGDTAMFGAVEIALAD